MFWFTFFSSVFVHGIRCRNCVTELLDFNPVSGGNTVLGNPQCSPRTVSGYLDVSPESLLPDGDSPGTTDDSPDDI